MWRPRSQPRLDRREAQTALGTATLGSGLARDTTSAADGFSDRALKLRLEREADGVLGLLALDVRRA